MIVLSSVQFSCSVMSSSLQLHGLQHARPLCPSPSPGIYSDSCPLSWWCHPTISSSVISSSSCFQSFPASGSFLSIMWPKCWSFSINICPSNEYSGLISFRMDWLDLLEVQGTLKSLLQHHSSKASILQRSAFFIVQLSHPYMTTGKTIALTRQTFVGQVMSLLFNMLSRLVIGEGNGTPLQYSCLENPMDGGAWWAAVHGVAKSRTRLSDFPFTFHFHALEKAMATHSNVLPGESQGWGSLVGCRLWGHTESDTTEAT